MKPSDCVCAVVGSRKGKTWLADLGKEFFSCNRETEASDLIRSSSPSYQERPDRHHSICHFYSVSLIYGKLQHIE